jgi:hypothetical protein
MNLPIYVEDSWMVACGSVVMRWWKSKRTFLKENWMLFIHVYLSPVNDLGVG